MNPYLDGSSPVPLIFHFPTTPGTAVRRGSDQLRPSRSIPSVGTPTPEVPASSSGRHERRGAQTGNTNAFKHGKYSKRSPNAIALNMALTLQRTREANASREKLKQESTPSGNPSTSPRIPCEVKARIQLMELTLKAQYLTEKTDQLKQQYDLFEGPRRLLSLASNAVALTSLYKVKLRSWEQRQLDKLINQVLSSLNSPPLNPHFPGALPGRDLGEVGRGSTGLTPQQTDKVRRVLTKTYSKYTGKKLSSGLSSPISDLPRCFFEPVNGVGWPSSPAYLPGEGVLPSSNFSSPKFAEFGGGGRRPDREACPPGQGAFLHDRAWHLLKPHIEDLLHHQQTCLKRRSRAIPYPVRFLMDGILWKLATGTQWADLPEPYPLRRCQQLYLQLCRAGLMPHLLNLLHEDLVGYGDTDLETLLQSGRFILYRNRVLLLTKTSPTWQELVALLLLQCGQKTALRVERLNPPPFSDRRLPGYQPGLLREPYLRQPAPYQPFVPPPLPKKYTLKGWHFLRIPAPFCHPLVCRVSFVIASHQSFHGGVAISSYWQNGRPHQFTGCARPPRLGDPPRPSFPCQEIRGQAIVGATSRRPSNILHISSLPRPNVLNLAIE